MVNYNATPEWETFAHSAQLARQGLTQAQMALAFLGDDERANRLTIQLQGVAELVSAMQSGHAALVVEHEELEELIDGNTTRRPYHGLVVGPIDEQER
jgi:hypothetical protein